MLVRYPIKTDNSKSLVCLNSSNYLHRNSSINNKKNPLINFVFVNQAMTKKELENILDWMFRNFGLRKACILAELLKEAGFRYATHGGISINLEDLKVPPAK